MTGAKKAATKEEKALKTVSPLFGTKGVAVVYRGVREHEENPLLASSLYLKFDDLLSDLIEEIKFDGKSKRIYLKVKAKDWASASSVFTPFVEHYLHKLAHDKGINVVMVAIDRSDKKNKKRFVAAAVSSPEAETYVLCSIFLLDSEKFSPTPRLFYSLKRQALEFLKRYQKELGLKDEPKVLGTVLTAIAQEFPEDEIKVHVKDEHDNITISIPLKKPEWRLKDFPEELAEDLKTLVIEPIKMRSPFAPKGMLLVGPPGVGKTILVEAIAGELDRRLLELEPGMYRSMWYGQTEKILREIFNAAKKRKDDVIMLIDDAEFLMDRGMAIHEGYISEMNIFLKMFQTKDRPLVALTTNHPQLLDQALVRPGRIDLAIIVGYPDKKFRKKIIENVLKRYNLSADEETINRLVRATRWFSNAEIDALIRMAAAKGKGKIDAESIAWARKRFHVDEGERERVQESLRWYAGKLQGMVISYVKPPEEV